MHPSACEQSPTIGIRRRTGKKIPFLFNKIRFENGPKNNGVDIIREFSDAGKSGLNSEDRPAFTEMMEEWVTKRTDFAFILCLDASRPGRFQDNDCALQFCDQCKENEKQLIYTITGKWLSDGR